MNYPGFLGPSNRTQSDYADGERLINFYLEPIQSKGAPTPGLLLPTPGFRSFATTTAINARALVEVSGLCFAVIGATFCQVFATGMITVLQAVTEDSNLATISYNGLTGGQLFITSGGNGYVYTLASGAWSQVLTGDATMGGAKDGRFLAFDIVTGHVRMSDLNDGLTWDALRFFARTLAPDPWQAMVVGDFIWMIGLRTSEAWYDAGTSPQPFAPIVSSLLQAGTNAPFSVALNGSSPVFLNHDQNGSATIVQLEGYQPKTISTYAVSTALDAFDRSGTLTQCETLVYQEAGHVFAVFNFAAARSSWAFDFTTGLWHERGRWVPDSTAYDVWAPRVHCHVFGKHLVGNRTSGVIAEMNVAFSTEVDSAVIRRVRVPPPLWAPTRGIAIVDLFTLRLETGLGNLAAPGDDPQVHLRVSGDGKTWGVSRAAGAGMRGQYSTQVQWSRCGGSSQLFVPEISVSAPIPWRLAGAEIEGSGLQAVAA